MIKSLSDSKKGIINFDGAFFLSIYLGCSSRKSAMQEPNEGFVTKLSPIDPPIDIPKLCRIMLESFQRNEGEFFD